MGGRGLVNSEAQALFSFMVLSFQEVAAARGHEHTYFGRIDAIDERVDAIDEGVDAVDEGVDEVDEGVDAIDEGVDAIDERVDGTDEGVDAIDERVDDTDQRIGSPDTGRWRVQPALFVSAAGDLESSSCNARCQLSYFIPRRRQRAASSGAPSSWKVSAATR